MFLRNITCLFVGLFLLSSCGGMNDEVAAQYANANVPPATFRISCPKFASGDNLPTAFRTHGHNPPFDIAGAPSGTVGFAIIIERIANPIYTHWVIVDVPGTTGIIGENTAGGGLPNGTKTGYSSSLPAKQTYDAPTINGNYRIRAYALNNNPLPITLNSTTQWTMAQFEADFAGSIIATANYAFIVAAFAG